MVSETILGAVVGAGAAIIASTVQASFNRLNAKDRIKAQNERQHAQFYAGRKIKALSELHSALIDCRQDIGHQLAGEGPMLTRQEVETQIWPLIQSLQTAQDRSGIFLDKEQNQAIQEAVDKVKEAGQFIKAASMEGSTDGPEPVEMDELAKETSKAMQVLENEISGPIEEFESNYGR